LECHIIRISGLLFLELIDMNKEFNYPNLFIVGAARAGTTSLWYYLKAHPEIFMPDDELYKEPAFFCDQRGIKNIKDYLSLFSEVTAQHKYIGEVSTAYLTCPKSAELINEYASKNNIKPKFIIVLRNPVHRAYSLYNWMVQEGYEYALNFKKALSLEEKRIYKKIPNFFEPEYYYNYLYFRSGLYFDQVKRYFDKFSKDNIHIIIFENFTKNTIVELKKIYDFLGIKTNLNLELKIHNPSRQTFFPPLQFALRKIITTINRLHLTQYKSKKQRDKILLLGLRHSKPKRRLEIEVKKWLNISYKYDILRLEKLINEDLSFWYKEFETVESTSS